MASITSLTGSGSSNSLYGTRNVISGLASGMDTEAMIQNAISGYEMKISGLNQKRTKLEWQQEAFRNIISKMNSFSNKYTSYTSSTNLMSAGFFNTAVNVNTVGEYADKVAASGKSDTKVELLGVKQLATSSSYAVKGIAGSSSDTPTIEGGELNLDKPCKTSNVSGSLTLKYGGNVSLTLNFAKDETFENGEAFAKAINEKLAKESFTLSGTTYTANQKIKAVYNSTSEEIEFQELGSANNGVRVTAADGDLKKNLDIKSVSKLTDAPKSLKLGDVNLVNSDATYGDLLEDEEITFTLDGVTKKISAAGAGNDLNKLVQTLNRELKDAFGEGKITVSKNGQGLKFETQQGSTLKIDNGKMLGLASNNETSYVNTGKKLSELLSGFDWNSTATMAKAEGVVTEVPASGGKAAYFKDEKGNRVAEKDGTYYRVDENGKALHTFEINGKQIGAFSEDAALESVLTAINSNADAGVSVTYSKTLNQFKFTASDSGAAGRIELGEGLAGALFGGNVDYSAQKTRDVLGLGETELQGKRFEIQLEDGKTVQFDFASNDGTVQNILDKVNNLLGEDYTAEYSKVDGGLLVKNKDGELLDVSYGTDDEIARKLFDKIRSENGYTEGQDAIFTMSIEGNEPIEVSRSSNSFEVDGMTINLKGTFNYGEDGKLVENAEAVTFETSTDSKKIVDAVKAMVEDYNAMAKEIKDAYSTLPMTNSKGNYYEPLTDKDREGMSDSAVEAYEKKAKTGILFGDKDLSGLYNRLLNGVQSIGVELEAIGIGTAYDNGVTTLTLDESKLTAALDSDPDKVRDIFTKSKENGSSADGLMQALKSPLDQYGKTTGTKGILIERVGSPLAPTSLYQNDFQKQLDTLEKQISTWQDKMADQVDYYTSKFTQLEKLINEMNAQSSALFGMTQGG